MDRDDKKRWYIGYSHRLWIPVSWEGFLHLMGTIAGFSALGYFCPKDEAFSLARHWPFLLATVLLVIVSIWITRGHVEKRY